MAIVWNLKKWLAVERNVYRPSELQTLLAEKAGVHISLQALSALINGQPNALRMQTVQAICNALDCKLSDFCDVLPDSGQETQRQRKTAGGSPRALYGSKAEGRKKEANKDSIFPDPQQFVPSKAKKSEEGPS
jgi:DNA-binding Xre family transcriptional regulator